jgi:hypothetical protein
VKIFIFYIFALYSIRPQLLQIQRHLEQLSFDFISSTLPLRKKLQQEYVQCRFQMVHFLSPTCRLVRREHFQQHVDRFQDIAEIPLFFSISSLNIWNQMLIKMDDYDILQCRWKKSATVYHWIIFLIVFLPIVFTLFGDSFADLIFSIIMPTFSSGFIVINSIISKKSLYAIIFIYIGLAYIVFHFKLFNRSVKYFKLKKVSKKLMKYQIIQPLNRVLIDEHYQRHVLNPVKYGGDSTWAESNWEFLLEPLYYLVYWLNLNHRIQNNHQKQLKIAMYWRHQNIVVSTRSLVHFMEVQTEEQQYLNNDDENYLPTFITSANKKPIMLPRSITVLAESSSLRKKQSIRSSNQHRNLNSSHHGRYITNSLNKRLFQALTNDAKLENWVFDYNYQQSLAAREEEEEEKSESKISNTQLINLPTKNQKNHKNQKKEKMHHILLQKQLWKEIPRSERFIKDYDKSEGNEYLNRYHYILDAYIRLHRPHTQHPGIYTRTLFTYGLEYPVLITDLSMILQEILRSNVIHHWREDITLNKIDQQDIMLNFYVWSSMNMQQMTVHSPPTSNQTKELMSSSSSTIALQGVDLLIFVSWFEELLAWYRTPLNERQKIIFNNQFEFNMTTNPLPPPPASKQTKEQLLLTSNTTIASQGVDLLLFIAWFEKLLDWYRIPFNKRQQIILKKQFDLNTFPAGFPNRGI